MLVLIYGGLSFGFASLTRGSQSITFGLSVDLHRIKFLLKVVMEDTDLMRSGQEKVERAIRKAEVRYRIFVAKSAFFQLIGATEIIRTVSRIESVLRNKGAEGVVQNNKRSRKIYTDTNVLRYFGRTFAEASLAKDLQIQLLLSPLSVMELVSQLATEGANEAFAAVHALPRVHYAKATGMLPWSDDAFRTSIFNLPPRKDTITRALSNAIRHVLDAAQPEDLLNEAREMRELLDQTKEHDAKQFQALLNCWRSEGPLKETEHKTIFARSIARRAGFDESKVDVDLVVQSLDALYLFESHRIRVGAENQDYNVLKRANDAFDAELLVYLADPTLHLLTADKGFSRVKTSPQSDRVHIANVACLRDYSCATKLLRTIVEAGVEATTFP